MNIKSSKIRTIIIDDEQEARDVLQNLLATITDIQLIALAENAEKGKKVILDMQPDLVFLDIRMPRKSGLDLAKELIDKQLNTTLVFVTAYDKFALEAIRVSAFDYLLKPVDTNELQRVIQRFRSEKQENNLDGKINTLLKHFNPDTKIKLNTRTGFILVDPSDVIHIQADGNYSELIFAQNRKELVSVQIGVLAELLPSGKFVRSSRSGLMNIEYLHKVDRKNKTCELQKDGDIFTIHISREQLGLISRM
jgi:two-component system LytT family response regulator